MFTALAIGAYKNLRIFDFLSLLNHFPLTYFSTLSVLLSLDLIYSLFFEHCPFTPSLVLTPPRAPFEALPHSGSRFLTSPVEEKIHAPSTFGLYKGTTVSSLCTVDY